MEASILGPTLAITCALTWSMSVVLFMKAGGGQNPLVLNLTKNALASVLMVPTILIVYGTAAPDLTKPDVVTLALSGVLGIGLADAMVLRALRGLGASLMAIVECAYSPFVILLSIVFLEESLTGWRLGGAALILCAIALASISRGALKHNLTRPRKDLLISMAWGVAGIFSMAVGIVLVKPLVGKLPLLWVVATRLAAGTAGSAVLVAFLPDRGAAGWRALIAAPRRGLLLTACILSTYVSMIFWVAGYRYDDAAAVAVLNQTATIFTVGFAALFLKERFTAKMAVSTVLALGGVLLITFG
jgi:drug/metabolite transporter (DMT)-like permease